MQITLNLDTKEKQAFFLALFNKPSDVVQLIKNQAMDDRYGTHPNFERYLQTLSDDELHCVFHEILGFERWVELKESYD